MKIEGLQPVLDANGQLVDAMVLINGQAVSCKTLLNRAEMPFMGIVFNTLQQRLAKKGYK